MDISFYIDGCVMALSMGSSSFGFDGSSYTCVDTYEPKGFKIRDNVYIYIHIKICMYNIYIYMYVYIYMYTHTSGQNKRGHHFVWPAVCGSRGFVRAIGFRVTLRASPAGSWWGLGLRRTLRAISRGSFLNPASPRGGSQRLLGFAEPSC